MLLLQSSSLPTAAAPDAIGAPVFRMGNSVPAPLFRAEPAAPVVGAASPPNVNDVVVTPAPVVDVVTVATGLAAVLSARSGGTVFRPAQDAASPQPGEFVHDPYAGTVAIRTGGGYAVGPAVELTGPDSTGGTAAPIANRKYVAGPYPDFLLNVPLNGEVTWSINMEQHPTGGLTLFADNRNIAAIRLAFRIGTKLSFYGIGFAVQTYDETSELLDTAPLGSYEISISLKGWNESACENPVYLFGDRAIPTGTTQIKDDPDCRIPNQSTPTATSILSAASTGIRLPTTTTVQQLGRQAGIDVVAPLMTVSIPSDSSRAATTKVGEEFSSRLRPLGCFADYTEPGRIIARPLSGVARWVVTESDILDKPRLTYQGRPVTQSIGVFDPNVLLPPQPDPNLALPTVPVPIPGITIAAENPALIGYTAVYPKTKLTGAFTNQESVQREDTRGTNIGKPEWTRRKPKQITKYRGDLYPERPLDNTVSLKTLSLNADASGPTKTLEMEVSEDDVPVKRVVKTYGFAYRGLDALGVDALTGEYFVFAEPTAWWRQIREEVVEYVYDEQHRYLVEVRTSGWELRRYRTETDAVETIALLADLNSSDPDTVRQAGRTLALYSFERVPLTGRTVYVLMDYSRYYADAAKTKPPTIQYKQCLPDGSSQIREMEDPTYSAPRFVAMELNYQSSFSSVPSPDDPIDRGDGTFVIPPPITKGRETLQRREVRITPSRKNSTQEVFAPSSSLARFIAPTNLGDDDTVDRYHEFTSDASAEGAAFDGLTEAVKFTEAIGKPPEHSPKKPPLFEEQKPEETTGDGSQRNSATQYDYYLLTPGYTMQSPEQGSTSFEYATTESQALTAATTDLAVQDALGGARTLTCTVPFNARMRPGDLVSATIAAVQYPSRITSVAHKLTFKSIGGVPYAEGETSLSLGPSRTIPVTMQKVRTPETSSVPIQDVVTTGPVLRYDEPIDIGALLSGVKTRRNF